MSPRLDGLLMVVRDVPLSRRPFTLGFYYFLLCLLAQRVVASTSNMQRVDLFSRRVFGAEEMLFPPSRSPCRLSRLI